MLSYIGQKESLTINDKIDKLGYIKMKYFYS
jgi:hypothetical protein